jgi:hypothetical protein
VVSTRKNARSAHLEILKVERFRMGEGWKVDAPGGQTPNDWSIFKHLEHVHVLSSNDPPP